MRVLVLHDLILDSTVVAVLAIVLDLTVDLRVLREDSPQQELLTQGETFNLGHGNVHELGLDVVTQVVVSKEGV